MTLWMAVTPDEFELPLAIEESAGKLAKTMRISKTALLYRASRSSVRGQQKTGDFKVVRVEVSTKT